MLRDAHAELATRGIQVVGVSPQGSESHKRFRAAHELPYPLLADPGKTAIRAWGADGPLGIGVRRITYLVGADGRIRDALRADFRIARHEELVRRALE